MRFRLTSAALSVLLLVQPASAANAIQTGGLQIDPPTSCCLGVLLPILGGDDDYDAIATLEYRQSGALDWLPALPLLRIRPETSSIETPPDYYGFPYPDEGFAGSVLGLAPDTAYELRVVVSDPDGGGSTIETLAVTAGPPVEHPLTPNRVAVTTRAELVAALAGALPGDVIELAPGIYSGPFSAGRGGTASDPVIIRGPGAGLVTIDAGGASYGVEIRASYVTLEGVTVRDSGVGILASGSDGVVIRRNRIAEVERGIDARGGTRRNYTICDNQLEGLIAWPDISGRDEEGIVVTGEGHTICHNTVSGFSDAVGLNQNSSIINRSIDFFGNDVLWSSDDGIELDYGYRNIRAFANRISNSNMGVSLQPTWGGLIYILRNVFINQARSPFKFNNEPSGFYVLHNTAVRTMGPSANHLGHGWANIGYFHSGGYWAYVANFTFSNNIVIGVTDPARVTSELVLADIDYNAWHPDGTFTFVDSWPDFAAMQTGSAYEQHGLLTGAEVFETPVALGADYTTFVSEAAVELRADSPAVDAGRVLPNINNDYIDGGPDMGARERGSPVPVYGVRAEQITDTDGDGIVDAADNCINVPNGLLIEDAGGHSQRDSDADGYGNMCDADLDNNLFVNFADLGLFRQRIGSTDADADLNGDGFVNFTDLGLFRQLFGRAP